MRTAPARGFYTVPTVPNRRAIGRHTLAKRRSKPGIRALREIRYYQATTDLLIRKAPFNRLVREITLQFRAENSTRWEGSGLLALQHAAEEYVFHTLENANLAAVSKHDM